MIEVLDNQNNLAYQCSKSNSIESFLSNPKVQVASRVDIYLLSNESLDASVKSMIEEKCPRASISESYVLEIMSDNLSEARDGPVIVAEFIDMTDNN